ncbi:DUF1338 domain-containing protein [Desertivirga brevis]|uniref:DUF1338 domain-containing protein n=1 Tax=Desertivirga brevis TaxID=2810310 RepID=UPI001A961AF9|nr:DUF1338 domain-containing protein [Pedobacter sp. SYSU D00873]
MKFTDQNPLSYFLNELFSRYRKAVPAVDTITNALIEHQVVGSQQEIVNDHVAFRTLGLPYLGIGSFEKIFLRHGYKKMEQYHFEEKKLNAWWYAPPAPVYPRVFLSELLVGELSSNAQEIINGYTSHIQKDPVDELDLNSGEQIAEYLHRPLWDLPTKKDYETLLGESEYAAWVIYNRYYLNHYTISVHTLKPGFSKLEQFNAFVEGLGIKLNDAGGKIKTSGDGLLRQSATVANMVKAVFAGGEQKEIAGSYVEFAERSIIPGTERYRDGFETSNADKIFESTYTSQIK